MSGAVGFKRSNCLHTWFAAAVIALIPLFSAHSAETRVALVVGNGAYQHLTRLANPANDAQLIAATLKSLGFKLIGDGAQTDLGGTFDFPVLARPAR